MAILEWYAWLTAFACVVVAALGATIPLIGVPRASYLIAAGALTGVGLARRLEFRVRAPLLLGVMYVGSSLPLFGSGTATPNCMAALCALAVLATALLGRFWGITPAGLGGATILVTALLLRRGVIHRPLLWSTSLDTAQPVVAFRIAMVFMALCMLLVISVSSLLRRGERLLFEKVAALEQAARERDEKEHAQRELALRDEPLHRAREIETLGRLAGCAWSLATLVLHVRFRETPRSPRTRWVRSRPPQRVRFRRLGSCGLSVNKPVAPRGLVAR